ncbi:MAG TPA: ion channel, partial [Pseudonocardiaceae bacterium]|nr:ion channel [Pseudonocardiaceae bacterium]
MRRITGGAFERLTDHPAHALVGVLRIPEIRQGPGASIGRRIVGAALALTVTVLLVYLGRDGYRDVNEDGLSLLDCIYYATVSLSTTGYGD